MTPFEYLSVLVSIILGLGLTHLLSAVRALIQMRARAFLLAGARLGGAHLHDAGAVVVGCTSCGREPVGTSSRFSNELYHVVVTVTLAAIFLAFIIMARLDIV